MPSPATMLSTVRRRPPTQASLDKYFKKQRRDEPQSPTSDESQPSTSEPDEPEPQPSTSGLQADDKEVL